MSKIVTAAAIALLAGSAAAQTTPTVPAPDTTPPPAVSTPGPNNPGAPVPGANSFTEAQAKARIADRGYTDIGPLAKDPEGIWRGKASKDGRSVEVALDYQGNVVAR